LCELAGVIAVHPSRRELEQVLFGEAQPVHVLQGQCFGSAAEPQRTIDCPDAYVIEDRLPRVVDVDACFPPHRGEPFELLGECLMEGGLDGGAVAGVILLGEIDRQPRPPFVVHRYLVVQAEDLRAHAQGGGCVGKAGEAPLHERLDLFLVQHP
jgi:hypothetical protein